MRNLLDKRALVTGAASGIGRALALRLAGEGTHLLLVDVNQVGLESVAREARGFGVEVDTRRCDVSNPQQISGVTSEALDRWAGVDLLVNNAGVTYHGFTHGMPAEEWDRLLAINLHSHLQFTRELLPSLLARPRAHVLNLCSMLGLVGLPKVALYCTTKFALVGFSESLRAEYGRWGLGVTAVCPGLARTNLFAAARPETAGDQPKSPPKWACTTPERVAKASIRAIKRNQPRVMLEPVSRAVLGFRRLLPWAFDLSLRIGESRRVARSRRELERVCRDEGIDMTEALKRSVAAETRRIAKRTRAAA